MPSTESIGFAERELRLHLEQRGELQRATGG